MAAATKCCVLCERLLSVRAFYRKGAGYHSYCKLCHRDRTLELRAAKREASDATPSGAA